VNAVKAIVITIALFVLAAVAAGYYLYAGRTDVRADREHDWMTQWLVETARSRAVQRQARAVEVRLPELAGDELLEAIAAYEDMCAVCHAPPDRARTALARGLNPAPPDLVDAAAKYPPEELFWVTRHGIRMTGMPAWGLTHSDEELWALVALIQRFPGMRGAEYEDLLAQAQAAGIEHQHGHDDHHDHVH
jgi:mono/diheme cytochrome c family protein